MFISLFDSNFTASACQWRLNYGTWILFSIPYPTSTKADWQLLFHAVLSNVFSNLLTRNSFHVSIYIYIYRIRPNITSLILISALHNTLRPELLKSFFLRRNTLDIRVSGWKLKLQIHISIPVQVFFPVTYKCVSIVHWYWSLKCIVRGIIMIF
jgi:hypothetical protein